MSDDTLLEGPPGGISLEAVLDDLVSDDAVRINPDVLRRQANTAEQHGNPQLAENLRRGAELTALSDAEVLAIYEALRPRRSSRAQLDALAARLEAAGAERCASLVREAADAYQRRGILL